jgi:hypothetical protein
VSARQRARGEAPRAEKLAPFLTLARPCQVGLSANQKKRLQIHPVGLLIILLALASWVVALGGVGAASAACVNSASTTILATPCAPVVNASMPTIVGADGVTMVPNYQVDTSGNIIQGNPNQPGSACGLNVNLQCALNYQMQWWTLFFEGILLISLFVSVFFEAFEKGKAAFTSFFVMCTTLLMISSNQFIKDAAAGYRGSIAVVGGQGANNAGAAGYVLLCIWNFCLLIILGYVRAGPANPTPQQLREEVRAEAAGAAALCSVISLPLRSP